MEHLIKVSTFEELYNWLKSNYKSSAYIWVNAKRGKPNGKEFSYIDAVYCALCFGWIDSTCKNIDGVTCQKLSPHSKNSHWTYLNIARCKYLIKQGLMTDDGLKAMPDDYDKFVVSEDILDRLQKDNDVWKHFNGFPILYQRIRIDNIEWARDSKNSWSKSKNDAFENRLNRFIEMTKQNKMYGEWNDYGRLE